VTQTPEQSVATSDSPVALPLPDSSAASHWAFINGWRVEPQFNDRAPAIGEVASSAASPSAARSTARRKHQAMFKQWSQDRHD